MSLHDIWKGDLMPESGVALTIGRNSFDPPAPVVPVYDIHHRSSVMHDSGVDSHSGVISFNSEKNRLELIGSNSGAVPLVTNIVFESYDSEGGSGIQNSLTTVSFNEVRVNTPPGYFHYDAINGELNIFASGTYDVSAQVTLEPSTATRTTARIVPSLKLPNTNYATIVGSTSYGYHRDTTNGEDTIPLMFILEDLQPGSKLRFQGIAVAGATSCVQIVDGSRLRVRKLS
jgi:hypothetical protein